MHPSRRSLLGAGAAAVVVGVLVRTARASGPPTVAVRNPSAAHGIGYWAIRCDGGPIVLRRVAAASTRFKTTTAFEARRTTGAAGTWAAALGLLTAPQSFVAGERYRVTVWARNTGTVARSVGILLGNVKRGHAPSGTTVASAHVVLPTNHHWQQVTLEFAARNSGSADTQLYIALPPVRTFGIQFTGATIAAIGVAPPVKPSPAPPVKPRPPNTALSGAYVGAAGGKAAVAFGRWRGRPLDLGVDNLDHRTRDSLLQALDDPGYWVDSYKAAKLPQLVLGVPMIDDARQMTLAAGARGTYDAHFVKLGAALVAKGYPSAILRVGWEANYHNSAQYGGLDPTNWRHYYRRIVAAMRSVHGQHFRFDLTASNTSQGWGAMYPGDDVVDIIGLDIYDYDYSPEGSKTGQQRWNDLSAAKFGINYWTAFANRTSGPVGVKVGGRKRLGVGEWAITGPKGGFGPAAGGDDADWISAFATWVRSNNVYYESYFDNVGDGKIDNNGWPKSAARYRKLFGAGSHI